MGDEQDDAGGGSLEQLSKGLVRYALSCEHSRKPIKRQDINEKGDIGRSSQLLALTHPVLGSHTRLFKEVFNRANTQLMDVWAMQLIELPKADRVTVRQRRGMCLSLSTASTNMHSGCGLRLTE
jgi:hypothetical protein